MDRSGGGSSQGHAKKTKASSSSSLPPPSGSADSSSHQGAALPVRPHLQLLPDVAYEAIECYMTSEDMSRMVETCQRLLEVYSGRVKEIALQPYKKRGRGTIVSLLRRLSGLGTARVEWRAGIGGLVEAMKMGYCNNLRRIEMKARDLAGCKALRQVLRSGTCPRLDELVVEKWDRMPYYDADVMMSDLGEILRIRAEDKGCSAIRVLELHMSVDLSSFFSSSAASGNLEDIHMPGDDHEACDAFSEWVRRTKAPRLRAFAGSYDYPSWSVPADLIRALSSEGVAPALQSFAPGYVDDEGLTVLTEAMERGAWPNLRLFRLYEDWDAWDSHLAGDRLRRLINVMHANNPELETLELHLASGGPDEDGWGICRMVAQALRDGAWPQLKELN